MGKGGIRSKEADELLGLDEPEMGVVAYPEFERHQHRPRQRRNRSLPSSAEFERRPWLPSRLPEGRQP